MNDKKEVFTVLPLITFISESQDTADRSSRIDQTNLL